MAKETISWQMSALIDAVAKAIIDLDYVWINAQGALKLGTTVGVEGICQAHTEVFNQALKYINFKLEDVPEQPSYQRNSTQTWMYYLNYYYSKELRKKIKQLIQNKKHLLGEQLMPAFIGKQLNKRDLDNKLNTFRAQLPVQFQDQFDAFAKNLTEYLKTNKT